MRDRILLIIRVLIFQLLYFLADSGELISFVLTLFFIRKYYKINMDIVVIVAVKKETVLVFIICMSIKNIENKDIQKDFLKKLLSL